MFGIKKLMVLLERLSSEAVLFNRNYKRVNKLDSEDIVGYAVLVYHLTYSGHEVPMVSDLYGSMVAGKEHLAKVKERYTDGNVTGRHAELVRIIRIPGEK